MSILIKIAFRNIIANRKSAILIGITIFFSSLLLLVFNSVMNGVGSQILRGYINLQSGNVAVIWEEQKEISNKSVTRFFTDSSFDVENDSLNKSAIAKLNSFIEEYRDEIKYYFPTIRRSAKIFAGDKLDNILMYSLIPENEDFLISSRTIKMNQGTLLSDKDYGICISKEKADFCNVKIGDSVTIEVTSPYGAKNILDFLVTGIYANAAFWDNSYGYISPKNAKELYDFDEDYFDIARIYLKNPKNSYKFAEKLDKFLLAGSRVLRAESYTEASVFFNNYSLILKAIFNIFILFLLIMIAIGLRATIKMNLFERMKEFGTIRAIGYSRIQNYVIIFFEIFFLSMISLICAFIISSIFVIIFGNIGIYAGSRRISMLLGGHNLYPKMNINDIFFTLIIITIFSLLSTFGPGMKICYQNISDLLLKRQRRVFLIGIFFRKIYSFVASKIL